MELIIKNRIEIRNPDRELKQYLKDYLTFLNPKWLEAQQFGRWSGNIPKTLTQYEESGTSVFLPRGVFRHLVEDLGREFEVIDETVSIPPEKNWPKGQVKLRAEDQEGAAQELLKYPTGFLSAPAGAGKTVLGLEICRRLGLKALWLTHRKELKDQAIEEANLHLQIPLKEIGVLHGKTWRIGPQLTVGMIPSMRKKDLSDLVQAFGVVILDEAHHAPCSSFLEVLSQFQSRYMYGLTATAYRNDKLEQIMFNSIGPITASIDHEELFEDEHLMKPTIQLVSTGWLPPNSHLLTYPEFMEQMVEATPRNMKIVNDVARECQQGNPSIVLVDRTKHAEVLTDLLRGVGISCEFAVSSVDVDDAKNSNGGKKKKAIPKKVRDSIISQFKAGQLQCLVTTYDLLAEGFNYRPLSRLFMAAPVKYKGTVVQSLGRIQRPSEGKADAIGYDYVDDRIPMFVKQGATRFFEVYKPMGLPIRR